MKKTFKLGVLLLALLLAIGCQSEEVVEEVVEQEEMGEVVVVEKKEEPKKVEKKETQEEPKEEVQEELKEEVKEETKPETKQEVKQETKVLPIDKDLWVTEPVRFRTGPSTDYDIILTFSVGDKVKAIGYHPDGWYKIEYDDTIGYSHESYLSSSEVTKPSSNSSSNTNNSSGYNANSIIFLGKSVYYYNGGSGSGQSIIDNNIHVASTWGGAEVWSPHDGMNTHFIGHSHGAFNGLWNTWVGDTIIVTDGSGSPYYYTVTGIVQVDEWGVSPNGTDYYWDITGTDGGERIVLQTCASGGWNYIIFARY